MVVWRWGCHQLASSAGETGSRYVSPASGHFSGRSYVPGSPCTRCVLTPGSPDIHKDTVGRKEEREGLDAGERGKKYES